jgi:NAD+ diphosphatase
MGFTPQLISSPHTDRDAVWYLFRNRDLLVSCEAGHPSIPKPTAVDGLIHRVRSRTVLGTADGIICCAGDVPDTCALPEGMVFHDFRRLFPVLPDAAARAAGYGYQLISWKRSHRFCGCCGKGLKDSPMERSRFCPDCGEVSYPSVSPAVIMAVTRGDTLLLARANRFPDAFFSVLAGYVEPGETLEACVEREVKEEVGIDVTNIQYAGSQSWPFSGSLMVAFKADYAGGELAVDGDEIAEAGWYRHDALPRIPEPISIARRLIDDFVARRTDPSHHPCIPL